MSVNDDKIKKLLGVIDEKREKLGTKPRMMLKTNGLIKFDNGKTVNINTINSLVDCVRTVAEIITVRDSYNKAAEALDIYLIDIPKFNGYSIEEWIEDFKLKVKIIQWNIEDKNIRNLESKLKNLRSEDLKTTDALDDISKDLNL